MTQPSAPSSCTRSTTRTGRRKGRAVAEKALASFASCPIPEIARLGRGRPEEVAAAVAFPASTDSSFMLGANVYVDGGANQI